MVSVRVVVFKNRVRAKAKVRVSSGLQVAGSRIWAGPDQAGF